MRRSGAISLLFIVLLAGGWLTWTLVADDSPQLGLDLQGGASVVLQPTEDVEGGQLDQAIEIIRNRVDSLGVAEPDIARQGDSIIIQLPGVRDQRRALEVVGRTAELRFRPVLSTFLPGSTPPGAPPSLPVDPTATSLPTDPTATTGPPDPSATLPNPGTTAPPDTTPTTVAAGPIGTEVVGLAQSGPAAPFQTDQTTTTVAQTTTTAAVTTTTGSTTTVAGDEEDGDDEEPVEGSIDALAAACGGVTAEEDDPEETVILPGKDDNGDNLPDACYQLGPVPKGSDGELLLGSAVSGAEARIPQNEWLVQLDFTGDGIDRFNEVAEKCFSFDASCPQRQIAITLDGVVESAPQIDPDNQSGAFQPFSRDQMVISGGQGGGMTERDAKDLALVLRYGALPVELEPQTVQTVSATLGRDSLRAGLVAGLFGVGLVALYMIVYYRALGVVVVLGLCVWSALSYSIISYLGEHADLALSLSGVTGIVVSVGVTVDSYVVYFERLKDEIRSGKTIRSSVDRGFKRAFRTILAADTSAFIGAALLYMLTVGPVRGFAFFLGLSTLLDIIIAYMFTRPLVALLGRSRFFTEARYVGVARGLGVGGSGPPQPAAAGAAR